MNHIANISGYKFTTLEDPQKWVSTFRTQCEAHRLKGTILISSEGWNIALAGEKADIAAWRLWYDSLPEGQNTLFKYSFSEAIPFRKLLVRVKNEIIRMNKSDLDPETRTGQYILPETLKQWLDEGRPVAILDTRNDYEFWFGHFDNAMHFDIQHFTQFPDKVLSHSFEAEVPIVTYCTGGVRCEKATSFMLEAGFKEVYQLEGGILNYFAQCGNAHYTGDCFVFDERIALNGELQPAAVLQCKQCERPIYGDNACSHCHIPYNSENPPTVKDEL